MEVIVTVPPTQEPISLEMAKMHLRVTDDSENTLIEAFITAARERCEGALSRPLLPQTRVAILGAFVPVIPVGPNAISVVSVTYRDAQGVEQTLDPTRYRLVEDRALVPVEAWPDGDSVRITFTCGAFQDGEVPKALCAWMLLHIGAMYEHREAVSSGALHPHPGRFVDGLLDPWMYYVV